MTTDHNETTIAHLFDEDDTAESLHANLVVARRVLDEAAAGLGEYTARDIQLARHIDRISLTGLARHAGLTRTTLQQAIEVAGEDSHILTSITDTETHPRYSTDLGQALARIALAWLRGGEPEDLAEIVLTDLEAYEEPSGEFIAESEDRIRYAIDQHTQITGEQIDAGSVIACLEYQD